MELLQVYDAGRQSSLSDVYANVFGTFLGAVTSASLAHRLRIPEVRVLGNRPFVPLLLLCWLGNRLFPYVPAGDLQKYWRALQPLVIVPAFPPVDVYKHVARWLAVAILLEAQCGVRAARLALAPVVLGVLFSRILIDGIRLSPAEVAGGLLAVLVWVGYLSRLRSRAVAVAALFAASVVLVGLEPFHFGDTGRQFQWIPFFGFLEGSFYIAVPLFFEKVFIGGSLVWLMIRAGLSWAAATMAGMGLVMAISICQTHLPGRPAEITDMLVVALAATVMKLTEEPHSALRN
jgi:VanZ family protein